ncbi:MAG TPA: MFS transporter [Candidatus Saccharimonadales bacterium]|nr:MFS transporter [Candidatus Saccharimonadales bacterium]
MRSNVQSPTVSVPVSSASWWTVLDGYQRQVFILATLAWLFDCLGQQVFVIARNPAVSSLMPPGTSAVTLKEWGGYVTSIFVIGWATGGLIFGAVGDRIGRARGLAITVLLYGLCTGLSGFSRGITDFCVYRFITGLGVGGVFGLAVALCADGLPDRSRPPALGLLQALSAMGNMIAGAAAVALGYRKLIHPDSGDAWRWLFILGAIPALLCVAFQFRLREPEKWVTARAQGKITGVRFGSYASLFGVARWRKNALFGMLLCVAGVVGLWGIGFFSPELVSYVTMQNVPPAQRPGRGLMWVGVTMIVQNFGSFLGMMAFTKLAQRHGRKKIFALSAVCAYVSTVVAFKFLTHPWQIFVFCPVMGFFQLALFAGFAIYLPELFPLRLRSTGASFCYNVGRFAAASGPFTLGVLQLHLAQGAATPAAKMDAFRDACCWVASIYLLALLALPFLPETKGQPLPED